MKMILRLLPSFKSIMPVIPKCQSNHLWPDFVEYFHEGIIDHESDGNIKNNAAHSWKSSFVECFWSLILHYLPTNKVLKVRRTRK